MNKRILTSFIVMMFVMAGAVQAHIFVLKPDKMIASKGNKVEVQVGLAEPLVKLDMSKQMLESKNFQVIRSVNVTSKNEKKVLDQKDFVPNNKILADATAETVNIVLNNTGTTVIDGKFIMYRGGKETVCYAKTFINLTNDGSLIKRFAENDDLLEIVFTKDRKDIRKGDKIEVQLYLKGVLLKGAEVSATYDGAPSKKGMVENEYITVESDKDGKAVFSIDRAGLWAVTVEYDNPKDAKRYRSSVIFNVK